MKNVKEFSAALAKTNPKLAALLDEAIARDEAEAKSVKVAS